MKSISSKRAPQKTLKLLGIGGLVLLMTLLSLFIYGVIKERETFQEKVVQDIYQGWGKEQTITGPFLIIPYTEKNQSDKESHTRTAYQILLPLKIDINASLDPKTLYRGIYQAVVYKADTQLRGEFDLSLLPPRHYLFHEAQLCLGLSQIQGLDHEPQINWDGKIQTIEAGTHVLLPYNGIHSTVSLEETPKILPFDIKLQFKGGGMFKVAPLGKTNFLSLKSPWSDPSFVGEYLPSQRDITDQGFTARWSILHLARSYPQSFSIENFAEKIGANIDQSTYGVKLFSVKTHYGLIERALKYFFLVIVATFTVYFLFELLLGQLFHPFQYILVGGSLLIFYLLLLSLSEYLSFTFSYFVSASAVILQIILYARNQVHTKGLFILGLVLLASYGYIYFNLYMMEYALLIGAIGLFTALGIVMYMTRHVAWYKTD